MAKDSDIISEGGVEPCRVVERSYEDEIERLRRVEEAARNVIVEAKMDGSAEDSWECKFCWGMGEHLDDCSIKDLEKALEEK